MKSIKVIEQEGEFLTFKRFSPNDILLYAERLLDINISLSHIDEIKNMLKTLQSKNNIKERPTIDEVLLRKLIFLAQKCLYEKKVKTVALLPIVPVISNKKIGGATPAGPPLKIHFKIPVYCIEHDTNLTFVSAKNEEIIVLGLKRRGEYEDYSAALVQNEFDILIHNFKCKYKPEFALVKYISQGQNIIATKQQLYFGDFSQDEKIPQRLIAILRELTQEEPHKNNYVAVYNLVQNNNLWNIMLFFEELGADSKELQRIIDKVAISLSRKRINSIIKLKSIKEDNKISNYMSIIEKKLGGRRLKELLHKLSFMYLPPAEIISVLTPKENNIVVAAYDLKQKYIDGLLNNDCPHLDIYKKLRMSRNNKFIEENLNALKKFFVEWTEEMFIMCNNCKFLIICPHIVKLLEYTLENKPYSVIKQGLFKFIDEIPFQTNLYCKICGEIIIDKAMESTGEVTMSEYKKLYGSVDDEFRVAMWKEIIFIINFVHFDVLIDKHKLIDDIINTIYDYVLDIQKDFSKSKTNSSEDIKNKVKLTINIMAFAYLINVMNYNDNIKFKSINKNHKEKLLNNMETAISLIMNTKNILISKINGITIDAIKRKIISAFNILSKKGEKIINFSHNSFDMISNILLDPVYNYIFYIYNLFWPEKYFNSNSSIKQILHLKVPNDKIAGPYDKFQMPKLQSNGDKYTQYIIDSFEFFMERLISGLYLEYVFDNVGNFSKKWEKYILKFKTIKIIEQLNNFGQLVYKNKKSFKYDYGPTSLSLNFDEKGRPHIWDIYVYSGGQELKIDKLKESGMPAKFIDFRCSVCGILKRETGKLNNEKILKALELKEAVNTFFKFYEYRCPEGGIHEFDKTICIKCKKDKLWEDFFKEAPQMYYKKYKSKYVEENKEDIHEMGKILPLAIIDYKKELGKWSFNYNKILELSRILNIKDNLIMSLGDYEGQNFIDVESGKFVPPEVDTSYDTRVINLHGFFKEFIFYYNNLMMISKLSKPPEFITNVLNSDKDFEQHEYSNLPELLPELYADYDNKLMWIKKNKKPEEVVSFILQYLVEAALKLYNDKEPKTKKIRECFVKGIIKNIILKNKLTTTFSNFNWNVFVKKGEKYSDVDNYNSNFDTDSGLATYKEQEDEDMGDTEEPLKNNFDVDDIIEDEDTIEENDIEANIGENYGLS